MLYFKVLRVHNWIKNFLIIVPLLFSMNLFDTELIRQSIVAFFSFSLFSSSIYILNDILDRKEDRLHPRKKKRPVASGRITVKHAVSVAFVAFVAGVVLAYFLPSRFFYAAGGYLLLNILYCFYLKHIALVDVFVLSVNFILRILAGCFAIVVVPSKWIIVVTFFLSLFLAFTKRKSEMKLLEEAGDRHRKSLEGYSFEGISIMKTICAAGTIISYMFYTIDEEVIKAFETEMLIYSTFLVALGLFRFIQISEHEKYGYEGDPTTLILRDKMLQIVLVFWALFVVLTIYAS